MAETFLFNVTEEVLSKVSSLALAEISLACTTKSEVKKLHNTLSTIKAVLLDANEQQTKNHELRDWLEKLKDAVYDADDLMDDLSTGVSPRKTQNSISVLEKVSKFFSCSNPLAYRFKIGHRISQIRKRLDEIAADRKNFHLTEQAYINPVENRERDQTHSFVTASDIIGRDSDKEFVIRLLLSNNDDEHVSIIPIVGLGGLGKTTLVKLVYNDDQVIQGFDLKMWISVSEDFSISKVVEKILKSATGETFSHLDMDQMQICLCDVLNAKRYLLVLDDVWNEDRNKWIDLKELLMNCSSGSKIIVTTRSKTVATIYSTMPPYNLEGLSDDDCLSLFLKCAFRKRDDWLPNLVEIGKEIVKKCGGVPLAVKTLGSLLYMKTDEQEWLHIRDNEIWEIDQKQTDILPILRLSYEQMSSYLRQCFAYCSMFPKGFEIPREVFINLWIAQGFIQSPNGNKQLENIGNQYFNELLSRFCFQDVVEAFDGEILACKIHNLVHDLAQSVAGSECFNMKSDAKIISDRVRHLYFHAEDLSGKEFPEALSFKMRKLRTFRYSYKVGPVNRNFIETITLKFRRLRVLVLTSLELDELPSSIGHLRKLRYLDLSHSSRIKILPNSICKLVKLQTLNLINCEQLQQLPRNIGNLVSLRTLYLTSQDVSMRKKGPESFSSLHSLLLYNCDFLNLPSEGLQHFTSLRVLRIYECQRLTSLPKSIKYLTALEKLWIWNCDELNFLEGEGLEGLKSLQSLLLMGLPKMVSMPVGLKETAAKTLKFFRIANCASLTTLPDWFLDFSLLQRLYVEDCPSLSFLPEGLQNLNAKVHISGCPKLDGNC
ncbi:putative disease resistance RPP13-like protein 1 [Abeliophyllum distichum]|uniref:Disease resistance RPP13-like protein 1 n=1 Tax=Abeliophyllum distichum TaxID=126358 RepID=A0ABD1QWY0_9LAMI